MGLSKAVFTELLTQQELGLRNDVFNISIIIQQKYQLSFLNEVWFDGDARYL